MTFTPAKRTLCLAADIKSWSNRLVPEQIRAQQALVTVTRAACREAGVPEEIVQQTGDGVLVIPPSGIDENRVIPDYVRGLRTALYQENRLLADDAKIRLRLALTSGMVTSGAAGFAGVAIIEVFRLLDSAPARRALEENPASELAVIVSAHLYRDVVQHGFRDLRPEEFWPVDCSIPDKGFSASAWVYVTERAAPAPPPSGGRGPASGTGALAAARELVEEGRAREALELLDGASAADPVQALDLRADALLALDRLADASAALDELLKLCPPPGPAAALARLGRCKIGLGDLAAAQATLDYLLKHHPESAAARLELGRLELARGRAADARDHLVEGMRLAAGAGSPDPGLLRELTEQMAALPLR
jgi:hypothetical protein